MRACKIGSKVSDRARKHVYGEVWHIGENLVCIRGEDGRNYEIPIHRVRCGRAYDRVKLPFGPHLHRAAKHTDLPIDVILELALETGLSPYQVVDLYG